MYFFLLLLGIPLNLCLDVGHKQGKFSKTLLEKGLKFVLRRGDNTIMFSLSLVLLPAELDPVGEKQGRKEDALVARGTGCIKIILTLSTKVIILYV